MTNSKQRLNHILLAAAVALPLITATSAVRSADLGGEQPPALEDGQHGGPGGPGGPGGHGPDNRRGPDENGPDHGPRGFGGPGFRPGFGGPGFGGPPPFLQGIALSDAQEDKVFAILHAEKPYLRDQAKAAAKAHDALRALAGADKYDDAKAAALAQAAAAASANIELQRVRTQQKLLAVLTPEQRKQQAQQHDQEQKQEQEPERGEGKPHRPRF